MTRSATTLALTGQSQVLSVPAQLQGLSIRAGNASDLTLLWQWGDQSGILYPGELDVWKPSGPTAGAVIPLLPLNVPALPTTTRQLITEFAFEPDGFPGSYPQQLTGITRTGSLQIASLTVPAGTTLSLPTPATLPTSAQGVGFAASVVGGNITPSAVSITGVQTGLTYVTAGGSTPGAAAWAAEVFPEDTQVTMSVTANVSGPALVYLHAYLYNPRTRIQSTGGFNPVVVSPVKAYAWNATGSFVNPNTPSIVGFPSGTQRAVVDYVRCRVIAINGASSGALQMFLQDTSGPTTLAQWTIGCTAPSTGIASDRDGGDSLGYASVGGSALQLVGPVPPANCRVDLDMGGYFQ